MLASQVAAPQVTVRVSRSRAAVSAILLIATMAAAAFLRFSHLADKTFWYDECFSVQIARLDWWNFLRLMWRREANMALYYGVLRFWLLFGGSEAWIRALSVVFSVATLPVIYALGKRLFDSRVGLIAAVLLSVNVFHVRYAQEARSYAMVVFFCALSSLFFLRAIEEPSRKNWLWYVIASALAVYSHFFGGLLILGQWASLVFLRRDEIPWADFKRSARHFAIAVLPIVLFVITTGAGPIAWIPKTSASSIRWFLMVLTGLGGHLLEAAYALSCAIAVFFGILLLRRQGRSPESWHYFFPLSLLIMPLLLTLLISLARPMFLVRYLVICLPGLVLLAAAGIARLRFAVLMIAAVAVFALPSVRAVQTYYQHDFDLTRDDWRSATQYILHNARPGDAVVIHIAGGRMGYEFYRSIIKDAAGQPAIIFPPGEHPGYREYFQNIKPEQVAGLPHVPRLWVILDRNTTASGAPDIVTNYLRSILDRRYHHLTDQKFTEIEVLLYSDE